MEFLERLSETLDKLTSLSKRDRIYYGPTDKIEFLLKSSEILERLRRLLISFKRDFVSVAPIHIYSRLRETL